jgi:hypothetical protein
MFEDGTGWRETRPIRRVVGFVFRARAAHWIEGASPLARSFSRWRRPPLAIRCLDAGPVAREIFEGAAGVRVSVMAWASAAGGESQPAIAIPAAVTASKTQEARRSVGAIHKQFVINLSEAVLRSSVERSSGRRECRVWHQGQTDGSRKNRGFIATKRLREVLVA